MSRINLLRDRFQESDQAQKRALLHSIRRRARDSVAVTLRSIVKMQPLLFLSPPINTPLSDRNLADFADAAALNPNAVENHAILLHEKWLSEAQNTINLVVNDPTLSKQDHTLAKMTAHDIQIESEKIKAIKRDECRRQHELRRTVEESGAPIVNAGMF